MGCSPPSSWYEQQNRLTIERNRREHQDRVNTLIRDLQQMTPEEKKHLKEALEDD